MRLSNSKAAVANRCWKKYEFGYVLGLKRKAKVIHLERGTWMHTLLEVHYANDPDRTIELTIGGRKRHVKAGADWRKAHKALTFQFNNLFEEERAELGDMPADCERLMLSYLARWEEEDADSETIATELDEWVVLPNGDEFNFIIDQVLVRSDGGVWLRDHKSSGGFMPPEFMLIDAQLARYFWAFKQIPEFRPLARRLRGAEFNELRTKAPTVPELVLAKGEKKGGRQVLTTRANLDTDYATYIQAIRDNGFKAKDYREVLARLKAQDDKFFRRTILPRDRPIVRQMMLELMMTARDIKAHEARGHFPRTPDKSCTWGCDFLEPCAAQLHGADITDIIKLKYDRKEQDDGAKKSTRKRRR